VIRGPQLAVLLCLAVPGAADEMTPLKPPLTKEQEKATFHPDREGMPPGPRLQGYERRLQMEQESLLEGLRFRPVGPEIQGGRIVDIEAPLAHPDAFVVAFASGGLWRTDNRGGSWTPLFDRESSLTIGDVALGDGEGRTIYVGTGENNSSRTSYAGTGIFKTTDGGRTWKHLGLADSHHIGRIVVDARDPSTVYVAVTGHLYTNNAERGVYKSTDGGETWTRVLFVDERTGAIDVVQDPARPEVLYAAMWERARTARNFLESGPGSGIWKTTDAGAHWTRLEGGLPAGSTVGRIGLAIPASRPQTVYAVMDNQTLRAETEPLDEETPPGELTPRRLRALTTDAFGRLDDAALTRFLRRYDFPKTLKAAALKRDVKAGKIAIADLVAYLSDANRDLFERQIVGPEVFRSDDGGATWAKTHEGRLDKVYYSFGYYFGRISVDPADPERIYFGGVPLLGSTDGGKTWTGLDQRGVHVDHHVVFVDPRAPERLALGNDGGLNLSFDHGRTWTKVNNLPVGQFTTLALDDARPYNIVGGLQDNGVMRGPSTYKPGKSDPAAWRAIYGGDGSAVAIDPKDATIVYTGYQFGFSARLNLKTGERTRIRPRPELSADKKEKPLRYNWVTPLVLSPHSREILYYGANRLYRSFDRGETWAPISDDLTSSPEQGDVPFRDDHAGERVPQALRARLRGHGRGQGLGHPRRRRDLDGRVHGPRPVALGLARGGVGLRRGDGLRRPERLSRRRVLALRVAVDRLRQDLGVAGRRPARGAGQHHPRGSQGQVAAVRRHRHGRVRLAGRGQDVDGHGGRPPPRARARPAGPSARGRPGAGHARAQRLPRGGGAAAQAHARREGQGRLRVPDQAGGRRPRARVRRASLDHLAAGDGGGADSLLGEVRGSGVGRDQGRQRPRLEGGHGPGPGRHERPRIRPGRGRAAGRRGGGGGPGQGPGEGGAREGGGRPRGQGQAGPRAVPDPGARG
jgi:photosystem II stability/assembly factor-like uncharacterized protein